MYFCLEQRLVIVRGQVIPLTVKEFEIFALLIMNPKRVFTYEMLLDLVWHEDCTYYSRKAINNHVSNLRKKIRIAPDLPNYVINSIYEKGSCRAITNSAAFLLKIFLASAGRVAVTEGGDLGGLGVIPQQAFWPVQSGQNRKTCICLHCLPICENSL